MNPRLIGEGIHPSKNATFRRGPAPLSDRAARLRQRTHPRPVRRHFAAGATGRVSRVKNIAKQGACLLSPAAELSGQLSGSYTEA